MPEYLSPGVYIEEVSFRAKSIEGVPTSTTGFAGMTRWGPVCYDHGEAHGPTACEPRLITSWVEFERVYGGLEPLEIAPAGEPEVERLPYLAFAAWAFFENGGQRLYVSRVFVPRDPEEPWDGVARRPFAAGSRTVLWRARWPGEAGNVRVSVEPRYSGNIVFVEPVDGEEVPRLRQVRNGSVVAVGAPDRAPDPSNLRVVRIDPDGNQELLDEGGTAVAVAATDVIHLVELEVDVFGDLGGIEQYTGLTTASEHPRAITRILELDNPENEDATVWLDIGDPAEVAGDVYWPARLMAGLIEFGSGRLEDGHDGDLAQPQDLRGREADPNDRGKMATGLGALAGVEDIAIVALPDSGTYEDFDTNVEAANILISHAERARYRIAIVDGPRGATINQIRNFRAKFDSSYAALYYPWVEIFDPIQRQIRGAPAERLLLPPSGFVAGIYARSDIERGVHKAPANEVIRGITRLATTVTKGQQDVLNPEGINALRFFEGRGFRVWGARTLSSDPEWKYVNVRRLFIFIEHSIDNDTQWAVFEPNGPRLWGDVQRTVYDFLELLWRNGALLGDTVEEAFFVRCDRTTMTQNDLDNGRMICLIGVAPVRPAEFVIFRIGQWTADANGGANNANLT